MNSIIDLATHLQANGYPGATLVLIVKTTIVLLIVRLLLAAMPRISAAAKHLLITAGLCAVVILPLLSIITPALDIVIERHSPAEAGATGAGAAQREIGSRGDDSEIAPSTLGTAISIASATGVVRQERLNQFSRTLEQIRGSWQGFILMGLGGVSLLLIGQMLAGMIGVGLVTRRSVEIDEQMAREELDLAERQLGLWPNVRLLRSTRVTVPVIWGVFRPALLLPADSANWTRERLRVVLLHELAHLKRFDSVTLLVSRVAVAMYWFQPLAWSLHERARGECERACDDLVLVAGTKPSDYAEHLLSIARALPQFDPFRSVTLAMTRRSQLEGRLLSILQPGVRRRAFTRRAIFIATVIGLGVVVPFAALRVIAAPKKEITANKSSEAKGTLDVTPETASKDKWVWDGDLSALTDHVDHILSGKHHEDSYSHGMALHQSEHFDEAIAAFRKSVEEGHKVDASLYNIACGFSLQNQPDLAIDALRGAMEAGFEDFGTLANDSDLDPLRNDPRFQKMLLEFQKSFEGKELDRADQLMENFEDLRSSESEDPAEWNQAGVDLLRLRRFDESIDAFHRSVALDDRASTAMYNLACAYSLKGDVNAGFEWLQRAITNGFDSPDKIERDPDLARLRTDSRFEGIKRMAHDFALAPQSSKTWFNKLIDRNEWDQWVTHHRELAQRYPNEGRPWFNLGFAELQTRNPEASIEAFTKALNLGYRTATTSYNIACAHAVAGRSDEAFLWLERARAAGFDLSSYLTNDGDLDKLRADPRYRLLVSELRAEHKEKKKHKEH